jgi:hypothetical protein
MDKLTPGQVAQVLREVRDCFGATVSVMRRIDQLQDEEAARREGEAPPKIHPSIKPYTMADAEAGVDPLTHGLSAAPPPAAAAPDELVQRLGEYLLRLTKDKDRYSAEKLVAASKERIGADAKQIADYCEQINVIDGQLDDYKESCGLLQKRVAELEAALRDISSYKYASPGIRAAIADVLKGADNG